MLIRRERIGERLGHKVWQEEALNIGYILRLIGPNEGSGIYSSGREEARSLLFVFLLRRREFFRRCAVERDGFINFPAHPGDYADTLLQRNEPGDREKATTLLDESLSISSELGMQPLMERVLSRKNILKA